MREDLRVAVLDHHGGPWQRGQFGQLVFQVAVQHARSKVRQRFTLDGRHELAGHFQAVVAAGQGFPRRLRGFVGKGVGVAFVGVDDDVQLGDAGGAGGGGAHARPRLFARFGALPEHHLAAARHGVHQLRSVLPRAGGDDVDGRAPAAAAA
ncbi:Uncharacterised protein [Mycobacterium tuberculosis]|uniref:Uncharacterized protein n=1 Tax=Mycobacterium tuberculosis TaxID=1773 RepID=A0A654TL99_MYCTX|nr:Uncharacterised protein [Mycobacterium tuberculosis]COW56051.1 Uncharacterised protein [Mycobacterium tuberculosis]